MELKEKENLALEQAKTAAKLVAHQGRLEEFVKQRADELEDSRRAALSLMEDAQIEKKRASEANVRLKEKTEKIVRMNKLFVDRE